MSAGIKFSVSGAILFAVYYFLGDSRYDFSKDSQHRILKRIHHPREADNCCNEHSLSGSGIDGN